MSDLELACAIDMSICLKERQQYSPMRITLQSLAATAIASFADLDLPNCVALFLVVAAILHTKNSILVDRYRSELSKIVRSRPEILDNLDELTVKFRSKKNLRTWFLQ